MRDGRIRQIRHSFLEFKLWKILFSRSEGEGRRVPGMREMRSGQSLVIIAVAFLGIVAFLGFAIDTGIIYLNRVWLGQAIDAAALAAGFELPDIEGACSRAVEYLANNGYTANEDFQFQIIYSAEDEGPEGAVDELVFDSTGDDLNEPIDCNDLSYSSEHEMAHYHVQIRGELTLPVVFMRVLGFNTIEIANPATAKRTAQYDVALVLDVSGSMMFDSCHYFTDDAGTEYETAYACDNRRTCSDPYNIVTFDGYDEVIDDGDPNLDMVPDGWGVSSEYSVELTTYASNVHSGTKAVHIFQDPGDVSGEDTEGAIKWNFSTEDHSNVAVYFWVKDDPGNPVDQGGEYFLVSWCDATSDPCDEPSDWLSMMGIEGVDYGTYPRTDFEREWVHYGIMLPNDADDNPNIWLRFQINAVDSGEGVFIDDIEMRDCPLEGFDPENKILYPIDDHHSSKYGCSTHYDAPDGFDCPSEMLLPGDSTAWNNRPQPVLLEQPMSDVIRGAESFVDIIRDRADEYDIPRTDQIGVVKFSARGDPVISLTTDYEDVISHLYTLTSGGGTNLGAGMRYGINMVNTGRPNTTHFVVLLTDGVLNMYDYSDPTYTHEGAGCGGSGNDPCNNAVTYVRNMIQDAQENNITFFTIGLGDSLVSKHFSLSLYSPPVYGSYTGMDVLEWIAQDTRGMAYHAPTTEELEEIFEWIAEAIFVRLTL